MIVPLLVIREAICDDRVCPSMTNYQTKKALFDHLELLVQPHPAAKDIDVAKALFGLRIRLDPGAETYYRKIGLVK